jgi:pimeloyl-ACP methyl ester carboxylesterase
LFTKESARRFQMETSITGYATRREFLAGISAALLAESLPAFGKDSKTMLNMVQTESLHIGYEQTGPGSGEPLFLLHGWPYDPRSFDDVRGPLADAGYRVIVPYLRCFGPTVYRSPEIFRSGQQSALGKDIIDLMDALKIGKATLIGYDWGGRGACVAAALWPERVHALMPMHGYDILDIAKLSKQPGDIKSIRQQWYRWYMNLPLGATELEEHRDEFAHECWISWSPTWQFSEAEFAATAKSFHNPDWVATTLNAYRSRYGNAPLDPALQKYEDQLARLPKITVPTIVLQGDSDPLYPLSVTAGQASFYSSYYERRPLRGVGHCPPKEAPTETIRGILDLLRIAKA